MSSLPDHHRGITETMGCSVVSGGPGSIDCLHENSRRFAISEVELVSLTFASWNQIALWLRQLDNRRQAA